MLLPARVLLIASSDSQIASLLPSATVASTLRQFEEALPAAWDAVVLSDELPELLPEVALRLISHQKLPLAAVVVAAALTAERAMALVHLGAADCLDARRSEVLPGAIAAAATAAHDRRQLEAEQARQAEQSKQEHRMLLSAITRIRHSLDLGTIFQTSTTEVRNFLGADRVIVYQFDAQFHGTVVAESVGAGWTPTLGTAIADTCLRESRGSQYTRDRIFTSDDVRTAGLTPCHLALLERFEVRSNLVVPIFQDEQVWGLLIAHQCSRPRPWQLGEIELLHQLATHLTIAIRQAEWVLLAKERQAREERDRLLVVVEAIRRAVGLQAVLDAAVWELRSTLAADRVAVYRFNDDWSGGFVAESVTPGWKSLMDLHNCDEVLQRNISRCSALTLGANRPSVTDTYLQNTEGALFSHPASFRIVEDVYQADFSECHVRALESYQARAYVIVPLFEGDKLWGLLAVYQNTGPRHWEEPEVSLLYQVATQLSVPLQQAALYQASQAQVVELERLAQLKDEFLSTVSHELRTPISNMRVAIHMLQKTTDEKRRAQYFAILESECGREIALVNNLLDLQRLDTHACPIEPEPVDLAQWLATVVLPFYERTRERQQSLAVQALPTLPIVYTEPTSLEQIVCELLNNAIKYTPVGEQIAINLKQAASHLELTVANTGAEIPQAELHRIFEKFYRIPSTDPWRQGGTGLGLALVRRLTKRLGGRVWVQSNDRTTTFTVLLPLDLGLDHCLLPEYNLEAEMDSSAVLRLAASIAQ